MFGILDWIFFKIDIRQNQNLGINAPYMGGNFFAVTSMAETTVLNMRKTIGVIRGFSLRLGFLKKAKVFKIA